MIENVTPNESLLALTAAHRLATEKQITDKEFNAIMKCVSAVIGLQNYGKEEVAYGENKFKKGEEPDCNKCGDYEYCAFHYDQCTGFIPSSEAVTEKIRMVDKERPISVVLDDNPLSKYV